MLTCEIESPSSSITVDTLISLNVDMATDSGAAGVIIVSFFESIGIRYFPMVV